MEEGKDNSRTIHLVLIEGHNKCLVKAQQKKGYSEVLMEQCGSEKFWVLAVMTWRKSSFFAYDPILAIFPATHASHL